MRIFWRLFWGVLGRLLSVGDNGKDSAVWIAFWAVVAVVFAAGFVVSRNRDTGG